MIQTKEIEYKCENISYRAFVAYDENQLQPQACVMLAHDWGGRSKMFCDRAQQLAQLGYVGVALDMYGQAKTGKTNDERRALLTPIMETRSCVTERMLAAHAAIAALPEVNPAKMAALGYCFGGLCVLDLARSGAEIQGVVSFHGILTAPTIAQCTNIRAKVLVLHGYDDPMVPPEQVRAFATEMTEKKVDWQIHMYGHTQHSFTNPEAHDDALGLHYNASADHRSWTSTETFLREIFNGA